MLNKKELTLKLFNKKNKGFIRFPSQITYINKWLIVLFSMLLNSSIQAASIEDFSRHPQYYDVKISPDGKHLAALVNIDGNKTLAFIETETLNIIYTVDSKRGSFPAQYYWANNERVVMQVAQQRGKLEQPLGYGELYAVNYDGSNRKMIFGYRAKSAQLFAAYTGHIIDLLPKDDKYILIEKRLMSKKSDVLSKVVKLNIYNGKERRVTNSPIPHSHFLIDKEGIPRFVSGVDNNYNNHLFYSEGKNGKWQEFGKEFKGEFTPIAFAENTHSIYVLKSTQGEPKSLYHYDLKNQKEKLIYKSTLAEPTSLMRSTVNHIYGLRIDNDYPKYIYLDEKNKFSQLHKYLYRAFKGASVTITSITKDGNKMIVKVDGDKNPGTFYLFDVPTMKGQYLFSKMPWIKEDSLSAAEPFRLTTPDGLTLNGLFTLPKEKKTNLPTVVLPHGGPHLRDYLQYDSQVQMLADAGYAVIQVNFRGSSGYGEAFIEAGYENWGTKIQDDISLATKYAISQGITDKDRICIFGASFGGYSALQSAIKFPKLYKCAIGYAGVYDLPMLYEQGDITSLKWGDIYLDKTLGVNKANLIEQSPVYNVNNLKAPVLLIHGEEDQRAPISHAEKLKQALEKNKHPHEVLFKEKEGHGFYNEKNILEANKKILSFLEVNIGD